MEDKKPDMKNKNILNLDEIREKKRSGTIQLLKDSRKIAHAVETRTCVICDSVKSCVNKAGICSYCFENILTPEEQKIAQEEARHKIIKIHVVDDRWKL